MGMALGNSITHNARPFDILAMNNGQPDWDNLLGIIEHWGIDRVLVGLPLNMDGTESMLTKRAHKFARRLAHRLGERRQAVSVFIYDERLSSKEAKMIALDNGWIASSSEPIDDIAACLCLIAIIMRLIMPSMSVNEKTLTKTDFVRKSYAAPYFDCSSI